MGVVLAMIPCSRTAPCKTFAGAISKTAAAGEINCLDPGGFGAVTITKATSGVSRPATISSRKTSFRPCALSRPWPTGYEQSIEHAASGEQGSDMALAGTAIIAPASWVARIALPASSEPGFTEPWPPRRGRIEWQGVEFAGSERLSLA
jgi:hypothetical protein